MVFPFMFLAVDTQWSVCKHCLSNSCSGSNAKVLFRWHEFSNSPGEKLWFCGWLQWCGWILSIYGSSYHFITYHSSYHLSRTLSGNDQDGLFLQKEKNFILSSLHPWGSQLPLTPTAYQPFPTTFPTCLNSFIFQVILSQFQGQDAGVLLQHRSQGLSKTGRNVDESNCLDRFVPRF